MIKALTIFSGNAQSRARRRDLPVPSRRARPREVTTFSDGEIFVEIDENVRGVNCFVVQPTCSPVERQPDGAAHHDRRAQARVGRLHHRGHPVLRLRPAGSQGQAAHARSRAKLVADLITAAGADRVLVDRSARRPDPGLLQHPLRPPLRDAGAARPPQERSPRPRHRHRLARRRRRRARARLLEAPRRHASPSSTSAARAPTSPRS